MKFSCRTRDLAQAVGVVSRAITPQQTIPILGNILLKLEGKRCSLSATNLEFSIITSVEVEVENEGEITIPTKALSNLCQHTTDESLLLESIEGVQLRCTSIHGKTLIVGEPASEYPTISPIRKDSTFTITEENLLYALSYVTFSSAKVTTRPVLSGVSLQCLNSEAIFAATDSYRLSEYRAKVDGVEGKVECIIPAHFLEEVRGSLGGKQKKGGEKQPITSFILSSQQVEVQVGNTKFLSRLIEGKFPDYKQILPTKYEACATLPTEELASTVRRMHYFAREVNNNITFTLSPPETLHLTTQATQAGKDEATLTTPVEGHKHRIALKSNYLLDFLSHSTTPTVRMEVVDHMHPAVFRLPNLPHVLHLIMPLRLVEPE